MQVSAPDISYLTTFRARAAIGLDPTARGDRSGWHGLSHVDFVSLPPLSSPRNKHLADFFLLGENRSHRQQVQARQDTCIAGDTLSICHRLAEHLVSSTNPDNRDAALSRAFQVRLDTRLTEPLQIGDRIFASRQD